MLNLVRSCDHGEDYHWHSSLYDHPGCYGLELVDSIEWANRDYEFDLTAVWRDKDGVLWMADDSGCSCPSPFEYTKTLERFDFEKVEERYKKAITSTDRRRGRPPSPVEWAVFKKNMGRE